MRWFLSLTLIYLLTGCSPLSKTQTKAANQYFQTIGNYTEYVRELNNADAKIKLKRLQLYPETYAIDSLMIESLVKSFEAYQENIVLNDSVDSLLESLDDYIHKFFLLTPNGFRVIRLITGRATLVGRQFGLGNIIATASLYNENNLVPRKAKKVKAHIEKGLPLMIESASVIKNYAGNILETSLSVEDEYIKSNYLKFLSDLKEKPGAYEYYAIYNKIFLDHFEMIHNTRVLANQLIQSADDLLSAHTALKNKTENRGRLKSDIAEIQELYLTLNEIKKTVSLLRIEEENDNSN